MGRWLVARPGRGSAVGALSVRRLSFLLLGVMALVATACSGDDTPAAAPSPTVPPQTTVPPSTTAVAAPATTAAPTSTSSTVRATTTLTTLLQMGPGEASIVGTVSGPAGGVDGAIVRIERLVGRSIASTDITTTAGGSYALTSILGGSYRVRALKPPDFATSPVEAFFLAANERKVLDLRMPAGTGERIIATVNPNPPRVDQPAGITIQVGFGRVDEQGRPALTPRPGVVLALAPGAGLAVESPNPVVTDSNGSGAWAIRCLVEGASTFTLAVGTGVTQVNIPACIAGPAPPTTRRP